MPDKGLLPYKEFVRHPQVIQLAEALNIKSLTERSYLWILLAASPSSIDLLKRIQAKDNINNVGLIVVLKLIVLSRNYEIVKKGKESEIKKYRNCLARTLLSTIRNLGGTINGEKHIAESVTRSQITVALKKLGFLNPNLDRYLNDTSESIAALLSVQNKFVPKELLAEIYFLSQADSFSTYNLFLQHLYHVVNLLRWDYRSGPSDNNVHREIILKNENIIITILSKFEIKRERNDEKGQFVNITTVNVVAK